MPFELGVYSFGNTPRLPDGSRGPTAQALRDVLEAIKLADEVGLDYFGQCLPVRCGQRGWQKWIGQSDC